MRKNRQLRNMTFTRVRNACHEIVYVKTRQYPNRVFPLIFLENGKPGYVINAYINYLMMRGEQESSLQQKINAVCQLYEFYRRRNGNADLSEERTRHLIYDFGAAKLHGTLQPDGSDPLNLGWRPVMPSTLRTMLRYLEDFDAFQTTYLHAGPLNPVEVRFQSAFERYLDFKARSKYDPFVHLFPSRSTEQSRAAYAVREHRRELLRRGAEKVFPADFVVDLIERTETPRDKMLLLLMAFGGLRRSEPLHLLHQDIAGRFRDTGAAWVVLTDPVRGSVAWTDRHGVARSEPRKEFFASEFQNHHLPQGHPLRNLQPRCLYGRKGHGLQVGFKGMTFSGHGAENFVHWLHEEAGVLFWRCYESYIAEHFHGKPAHWPYHPFLFIRLDAEGYGLPLTLPAVEKMFERACARIGLSGFGPHALRHFYGYYAATILKLPIEQAQVCLHHASVVSTQAYYRTAPEAVRREILVAAYAATGRPLPIELAETAIQPLTIPHSWRADESELLILRHGKARPSR